MENYIYVYIPTKRSDFSDSKSVIIFYNRLFFRSIIIYGYNYLYCATELICIVRNCIIYIYQQAN